MGGQEPAGGGPPGPALALWAGGWPTASSSSWPTPTSMLGLDHLRAVGSRRPPGGTPPRSPSTSPRARRQTRWFGGMVGDHVAGSSATAPPAQLPTASHQGTEGLRLQGHRSPTRLRPGRDGGQLLLLHGRAPRRAGPTGAVPTSSPSTSHMTGRTRRSRPTASGSTRPSPTTWQPSPSEQHVRGQVSVTGRQAAARGMLGQLVPSWCALGGLQGDRPGHRGPGSSSSSSRHADDLSMPHTWTILSRFGDPELRGVQPHGGPGGPGGDVVHVPRRHGRLRPGRRGGAAPGRLMQRFHLAERSLLPYVILSQTVPLVALAPLVVGWAGGWRCSATVGRR